MELKKAYKALRANNPNLLAWCALENARRAIDNPLTTEWQLVIVQDSGKACKVPAYNKNANPWNPSHVLEGTRRVMRWCEDTEKAGLRFVGYADDIVSYVDHKGWYTDDDGTGETIRGAVWQLPSKNGEGRFIGGYIDPYNGEPAAHLEIDVFYDSELGAMDDNPKYSEAAKDAAVSADSLAEWCADLERQANIKHAHEMELEDALEAIEQLRLDHTANIAALKAVENARAREVLTADCARIRREASSTLGTIRCKRCILS